MSLSLHSAFVPTCLQVLGSMIGILEKAEAFCKENDLTEEQVINAKLAEDMLPFCYQVKSTVTHSLLAIESLADGVFSPDMTPPAQNFADLKEAVQVAISGLEALSESDLEQYVGRPTKFQFRDFELPFTAENFLLSFSQPNFFFHATTAYDLLRLNGVPVGKMDFMGAMRAAV